MSKNDQKVKVHAEPAKRRAGEEAIVPLVDVYETEDGTTVLVAEVPGAEAGSIDVRVDKGVLTVAAEAKGFDPGEQYSRTYIDFTGGEYFRAFALSDGVDREKIEASIADGVLTVKLPRAAAAKTRRIEVTGG